MFQLLVWLISITKTKEAAAFHDGFWTLKFIIVLLFFVGSMWIPNDPFMVGYMKVARYSSSLFLVYQGLIMLVVAHTINSALVGAADSDPLSSAGMTLLAFFGFLTIGNVAFIAC